MSEEHRLVEINDIFCEVLNDFSIKLNPDSTAEDVDGWDSLTHMMIITAVEVKYGLEFKLAEVMKFRNIGDLLECIKAHDHPRV